MSESIRVFRPFLPPTAAIAAYMEKAAERAQYSNGGPLVTDLEARLAAHFGVDPDQVAVCSSGTTALEGAVATSAVDTQAVWEVPAWTFTATPGAVLRVGNPAHFVDVDDAQRALFGSAAPQGIDVLPFGAGPYWSRRHLPRTLIVDAAASFDACENFAFPGRSPAGVIVSMHATKSLPAGEGGVFFSNDRHWVDEFRRYMNFGMWNSRISQIRGTNGKMSEFTAAVAHASLDEWSTKRGLWIELGDRALRIATDLAVVSPADAAPGVATPYWNIQVDDEASRVGLEKYLSDNGVETRRWWGDGCHVMPAYLDVPRGDLVMTESVARTTLGLPFHLGLSFANLERIGHLIDSYAHRDRA